MIPFFANLHARQTNLQALEKTINSVAEQCQLSSTGPDKSERLLHLFGLAKVIYTLRVKLTDEEKSTLTPTQVSYLEHPKYQNTLTALTVHGNGSVLIEQPIITTATSTHYGKADSFATTTEAETYLTKTEQLDDLKARRNDRVANLHYKAETFPKNPSGGPQ